MKKFFCIIASLILLTFAACTPTEGDKEKDKDKDKEKTEITLWTYPVGGWGKENRIASFVTAFHNAHPDILVNVSTVDYTTGDAAVEEAIAAGKAPDLILEGPERLSANWGARDLMADLGDLWEEEEASAINPSVEKACRSGDSYYIYPICMTTHCMAINRDLFEAADAWQYIDEATHTWSTQDFIAAVGKIKEYYDREGIEKDVAAVYCKDQGGDQGTRALVTNLYGGTFTNEEHTAYTVDSEQNIRALELLRELDGIRFDADMVGSEEIEAFCSGDLAMAFCWNVVAEINHAMPDLESEFDIFPMAFPTDGDSEPSLAGGIWGFGVFDNGDEARIEAAKEFIRYIVTEKYAGAVTLSSYLPVREMEHDPYENDELMQEYGIFSRYLGDYYQVTPNWADARTAWWQLLQKVGEGADIAEAVRGFPIVRKSAEDAG